MNPLLAELVKRSASNRMNHVANLESDVVRQHSVINRLVAELKAAKADAKAARLEVRLFVAEQAQRCTQDDLVFAYWERDQDGEEKAA